MIETHSVYKFMKNEIKKNLISPALLSAVVQACQKAMDTKFPILISGDQGVGKTFGVQYFAYKNKLDITIINASDELRKKEGQLLIRSILMKPSSKLHFLVIDEVEKDTNIKFLADMVKLNRKISFKTNVVMICITNHYWTLGPLQTAFASFHEQIKPPYIRSLGTALRERNIKYKGKLIRDLRFFRSIIVNPDEIKSIGISDNTFEAIQNFLKANIKDRNSRATESNLNARFYKWILANFHHGTFMYIENEKDGSKRSSFPKHNSAMFHRASECLSLADMYGSADLKDFVVKSELTNPYLQHPSSLSKKNKEIKL